MFTKEEIIHQMIEQGIFESKRPTAGKHKHIEAFCIMVYEHDRCKSTDYVYNTRDGVTPFLIVCRKCHPHGKAEVGKDVFCRHKIMLMNYQPDFVPPTGMSIFVGPENEPSIQTKT